MQCGAALYIVKRDELERFRQVYVSLFNLTKERGVHLSWLK